MVATSLDSKLFFELSTDNPSVVVVSVAGSIRDAVDESNDDGDGGMIVAAYATFGR